MIGKLTGIVELISADHAIIDVGGVGYIVFCSSKTLDKMLVGNKSSVIIETHVREDQITLYGFVSTAEKKCFLDLRTVKGVGPKSALQILSYLTPDQIYTALMQKNESAFKGISGVGPKLINRIFAELNVKNIDLSYGVSSLSSSSERMRSDAVSALVNLGINKNEAHKTVSKLLLTDTDVDLNNLIKNALAELTVK